MHSSLPIICDLYQSSLGISCPYFKTPICVCFTKSWTPSFTCFGVFFVHFLPKFCDVTFANMIIRPLSVCLFDGHMYQGQRSRTFLPHIVCNKSPA